VTGKLQIAKDLALPIGAVTQTIAILGVRGSGKTNTGVVFAEELLDAKQQVVIIDPV
jgi:polynucleotide 5'-kinase involved in rRNA processing